jgi:hypothetical protein
MLGAARRSLGLSGRPNAITRAYASRHGVMFLMAPWCNQAITEWANNSGNARAVLPNGDRAYTLWHAEDGKRLGLWYAGTETNIRRYAKPGAIVFFDWAGSDEIQHIDHVGIVEVNLGDGRVQTIEGNTSDMCKRRVRAPNVIAGFWNPPYIEKHVTEVMVDKLPLLKPGAKGKHSKTVFYLLPARGYGKGLDPKALDPMVYSPKVVAEVKRLQKAEGLKPDGEVGPKTWPVLLGL